jgi:hypothetical protein
MGTQARTQEHTHTPLCSTLMRGTLFQTLRSSPKPNLTNSLRYNHTYVHLLQEMPAVNNLIPVMMV